MRDGVFTHIGRELAVIAEQRRERGNRMVLSERQIKEGIRFGDWMLVPLDECNWELCHWHVAKATGRNKGGTEQQWNRCGRYYSYNTFQNAVLYAADVEMKTRCEGRVVDLHDALKEWKLILDGFVEDFKEALGTNE